ncbi:MAG: HAD hydrolase-like protein [Bacteroidetes bacterium]|jgi:putative hydrolase of the HAD superfamily|nr:HAD hydrolase-like protein [Bacteroidota bacterium]
MKYMKDLLDSLAELKPKETGVKPVSLKKGVIKACIFDIYGTMLISDSGDIDLSNISGDYLERAFYYGGVEILPEKGCSAGFCDQVIALIEQTIKNHHQAAKQNGYPYPEVNIPDVWMEVLLDLEDRNTIIRKESFDIKKITAIFEVLSNKVYPMPGMKDIVMQLSQLNIPLGIISNAQFYTPVIMNYFLSGTVSEQEMIDFFDPELTVFSYKEKRAKPDVKLFEKIKPRLRELGIDDNETLFVGNDMLKDIYTANKAGFKTALFAGDKRSLRMRSDYNEVKTINPDYIITDLSQINEIM